MADKKVAVVTGGNTGIGLTVAERLLSEHKGLQLCLACRNKMKAEAACEALQVSHPEAKIDIVILDTSNVESVFKAAKAIKDRYKRLDYLFLNAGIMSVKKVDVNWDIFWKNIFTSKCLHMFKTGDELLVQHDEVTEDGLMKVFATNVFGHFVLIREMDENLGGGRPSQLIWTSSSNASQSVFDIDDVQHKMGHTAYTSSKYATDIVSIALNDKMNSKGVYSHATCPGLVITNLTHGILPSWFWTIIWPLILLMRIFMPGLNYSTYNGSESLIWLTHQQPESLSSRNKYLSQTGLFGKCYVVAEKIKTDDDVPEQVYNQLESLYQQLKNK